MTNLYEWCIINNRNDLLSEWDSKRNHPMTPKDVTIGSGKKVWWTKYYFDSNTNKSFTFHWQSRVADRQRLGCPYLSKPAKAVYTGFNDLFTVSPNLKNEWNFGRNVDINPLLTSAGSGKKAWWKCPKGHNYLAVIRNRVRGSNCPYCAGQLAIEGENDLVTKNPPFLKEWDYEKNIGLEPSSLMIRSNKSVWWKCELGHSWKTTIAHRAEDTRCPQCYKEYGTSFAEQAICYYLKKHFVIENRAKIQNFEIDVYIPSLRIGFEYDGIHFHKSKKSLEKEKKKNDILCRNGITLYRIKESTSNYYDEENRIIYCLPDRKYEYLHRVVETVYFLLGSDEKPNVDIGYDSNSIYQLYIKGIKDSNFLIKYPHLAKEWDYLKNGDLKPEFFSSGSQKKVWWRCNKCGSSYKADILHKSSGTRCPYCNGKKVNETNSLANRCSDITNFWDYSRNEDNPSKIYYSSQKSVFWLCEECGDSYRSSICLRINAKTNLCPKCMHKHIGRKNREICLEKGLSVADDKSLLKDWHFAKNVDINPKKVPIKSGMKIWWICSSCGKEWKTSVSNRSNGTGCPVCKQKIAHGKHKKPVLQFGLDGNLIREYESVRIAISSSGFTNLTSCLAGKCKTCGGYIWKYK